MNYFTVKAGDTTTTGSSNEAYEISESNSLGMAVTNTIDIKEEFSQLQEDIKRAATCFLGCSTYSDDIVQDVFLELLKKGDQFEGRSSFKTFALAITRNISYKYIKRLVKDKELSEKNIKSSENSSEAFEIDSERLNAALKKIPAKHREPLLLREMERYSYDEIAEIMKIKVGTVKFRINYAKKKLVKILNKGK